MLLFSHGPVHEILVLIAHAVLYTFAPSVYFHNILVGDNHSPFHIMSSDRRQPKTLLTIDERGFKSLERVFSIVICRQSWGTIDNRNCF